eukprot:4085257-Amphidinium_carterae.2
MHMNLNWEMRPMALFSQQVDRLFEFHFQPSRRLMKRQTRHSHPIASNQQDRKKRTTYIVMV